MHMSAITHDVVVATDALAELPYCDDVVAGRTDMPQLPPRWMRHLRPEPMPLLQIFWNLQV
jgi:hypothetical protein